MKIDSIARYQECRLSLRMQTCNILDAIPVGSHSPHTGLFRETCYGLTREH